jgi:hypothetical protein
MHQQLCSFNKIVCGFVNGFLERNQKYYRDLFHLKPDTTGGEGVVCEIDESLFSGKRKNHVGRILPQVWVFAIVDLSFVPARGFMKIVERRNAQTLLQIVTNVCREGTKIYSDEWRAYNGLASVGFEHFTVNHSVNFINPENGVHTQHIESYWNRVKRKVKMMNGVRRSCL